jgi:hypothetical protein
LHPSPAIEAAMKHSAKRHLSNDALDLGGFGLGSGVASIEPASDDAS